MDPHRPRSVKLTKGETYYRVADDPALSCATCRYFQPRAGVANGTCALVKGIIEPEDTCDLWEAVRQWQGLGVVALATVGLWFASRQRRR